jgi:hypothetical protein
MSAELHDVLRNIAFQCVFVGIGATGALTKPGGAA